jgi:hypothetical protein
MWWRDSRALVKSVGASLTLLHIKNGPEAEACDEILRGGWTVKYVSIQSGEKHLSKLVA